MSKKLIDKIIQLVDVTIEDRHEIKKLKNDLLIANKKIEELLSTVKYLEKEMGELRNQDSIA